MKNTYFDQENLTIQVYNGKDDSYYEVDLEECMNSAGLLDAILQVADKSWCSPQTLYDFIETIEEACQRVFGQSAQGVFCPFGQDQQVDWTKDT